MIYFVKYKKSGFAYNTIDGFNLGAKGGGA
jgi:hypothetical protein